MLNPLIRSLLALSLITSLPAAAAARPAPSTTAHGYHLDVRPLTAEILDAEGQPIPCIRVRMQLGASRYRGIHVCVGLNSVGLCPSYTNIDLLHPASSTQYNPNSVPIEVKTSEAGLATLPGFQGADDSRKISDPYLIYEVVIPAMSRLPDCRQLQEYRGDAEINAAPERIVCKVPYTRAEISHAYGDLCAE